MSAKRDQVLETAERLFYREGFHATGVDRVIAEAGVARMTLYKHFQSKDELVLAVLARREQVYWAALTAAVDEARAHGYSTIRVLFETNAQWLIKDGAHGCLFLKALGEYAGRSPSIVEAAVGHKQRLLVFIRELIRDDGLPSDQKLEEPLALILEGATAYAQILPPDQVTKQALHAADTLIQATINASERPS